MAESNASAGMSDTVRHTLSFKVVELGNPQKKVPGVDKKKATHLPLFRKVVAPPPPYPSSHTWWCSIPRQGYPMLGRSCGVTKLVGVPPNLAGSPYGSGVLKERMVPVPNPWRFHTERPVLAHAVGGSDGQIRQGRVLAVPFR